MEIKKISYKEVHKEFADVKPDLLDEYATYYGCLIKDIETSPNLSVLVECFNSPALVPAKPVNR